MTIQPMIRISSCHNITFSHSP